MEPRVGVAAETLITLQQVLAMALANNKDIEASRIDRQVAGYNVVASQGVFDPRIGADSFWRKNEQPTAAVIGGSPTGAILTKTWQSDPSLNGFVPWGGGSYKVDVSSAKVFTNNTFVTLNPQFPTALNLSLTQPLWRGLLYDVNRHGIDVAKKSKSLSDEQFRERVMTVATQAEQAYWELAFAYNNLQVQLDAVRIAQQQDESNRRQQQQGLLAPIDVVAAQTQLANFEISAITAQESVTRAENTVKTLILPDRTAPLWSSALVPATPVNVSPTLSSLDQAVAEALANRPEAAQVRISSEINDQDTRLNRDLTRPQVDLTASYTNAGLTGTPLTTGNPLTASFAPLVSQLNALSTLAGLPPISLSSSGLPAVLLGGYGNSLAQLGRGTFPTAEIELKISLPIRNRTAEATLGASLAQGRRIRNQKEQVEQAIEADVRNSMQGVQSSQARLQSARIARESAEEQYQSEQRQFQAGTSTLFLVQQRQSEMIAARSQERRAEANLGQAVAALELSTGRVLIEHDIHLQ